jgi:hypothetical protein
MSGAFEERLVDADLSLALRLRGFLRFRRRAGMGEMLDHKLIEMSDEAAFLDSAAVRHDLLRIE